MYFTLANLACIKSYGIQLLQERDANEISKEKAEARNRIATKLEKLKQIAEGNEEMEEFLTTLYKEFPPRRENCEKEFNSSSNAKRALVDYSPDKQAKDSDLDWIVLCEEITKEINKKY